MLRPMKTFTRNRRRKYIETYAYAPDFINKLETVRGRALADDETTAAAHLGALRGEVDALADRLAAAGGESTT
jgi:hypothetical protein